MYRVTLKPGHPRGIYRRSGREFTREGQAPVGVQIAAEEITEEILNDPWLIVEQLKGKELKEAKEAAKAEAKESAEAAPHEEADHQED